MRPYAGLALRARQPPHSRLASGQNSCAIVDQLISLRLLARSMESKKVFLLPVETGVAGATNLERRQRCAQGIKGTERIDREISSVEDIRNRQSAEPRIDRTSIGKRRRNKCPNDFPGLNSTGKIQGQPPAMNH
jgi:hypothetical protein